MEQKHLVWKRWILSGKCLHILQPVFVQHAMKMHTLWLFLRRTGPVLHLLQLGDLAGIMITSWVPRSASLCFTVNLWPDLAVSLPVTSFFDFSFSYSIIPVMLKNTHSDCRGWGRFMVFIYFWILFSVKWLSMFYYTYNNEEVVYIHPQDLFRKNHKELTKLKHTHSFRAKCCTSHTPASER